MTLRFWNSVVAAGWMASAAVAMVAAAPAQSTPAVPAHVSSVEATVKQYCVTCHNARTKTADLSLEGVDTTDIPANAEIWERVVRKL